MTRTDVTRIVRIVFFLWLIVSIALGLTTIVALLPLPDQRHEYEEAGRRRVPPPNGDRQAQSLPYAGHSANPTSTTTTQAGPGASPRQERTIPQTFCGDRACSVTFNLQDLVATLNQITNADCPWLLRLTSTVLTVSVPCL
jgi:hypothetical protein